MFLSAAWAALVLFYMHGAEATQTAGIFVIETFGTFLLAKRYIRNLFAFQRMVSCLVLMIGLLLPFAAYENVTGSPILIQLFGQAFSVFENAPKEPRLGLSRAQAAFEHPILFGVACSSAFALSYYVLGATKRTRGALASTMVGITAFASLSAGPLLSVVVQGLLIVWDKITARKSQRWLILATLIVVAYFVVGSVSNRTGFEVFISYLTFNADQSYMRVHIWNYGTQSVMQHPIFGTGMFDWERPSWMGGSIDNFWLVAAVRYGIPGFLLTAASFLSVCFGLGRLRNLPFQVAECRKGLVITICGLAVALCTVHLWNATYVLFIFLLGSGMWMFEHRDEGAAAKFDAQNSLPRRR